MLYYDRIDVSEGIDVNKTYELKDCDICHYWYFLDKGFKFQPYVCNGCHDVLMMSINLCDIAILNNHGVDYNQHSLFIIIIIVLLVELAKMKP